MGEVSSLVQDSHHVGFGRIIKPSWSIPLFAILPFYDSLDKLMWIVDGERSAWLLIMYALVQDIYFLLHFIELGRKVVVPVHLDGVVIFDLGLGDLKVADIFFLFLIRPRRPRSLPTLGVEWLLF